MTGLNGQRGVSSPEGSGRSVLEGAFRLLDVVERQGEAGLSTLAAECGLPRTTAYRLLDQLVGLRAVERRGRGYRLGPRLFRLGQGWQPYSGLRSAAREPARRLARATGTMVGVSVLSEGRTLVLDWTVCVTDDALAPLCDEAVWPWFTAAGKVLVAGAPAELPPGPSPASWRAEAAAIRERGVAYDREEVVPGVCCAAVPLRGAGGTPVAALCVVTDPAHRLDRLADALDRTGRAIGARLRHR
ncbi:IclR family transcriptional regulator [Streptomyces sp. NBC_00582]|uniref:IclR family transcriptional regulator n=1 Tax=Streptomyces sp. NBC_00582 TaxID=2975783 RepID=UPI002E80FE16|nr:helix-turn-helix domain-containing protein [Streptomyces sp. NBC_00582]WUB59592.1 helix-turn-helix domain-containing protein [Streptomyces sp. NBC_00582]